MIRMSLSGVAAAVLLAAPLLAVSAPAAFAAPVASGVSPIIPLPLRPIVPVAQRACAAKTASGLGYTALKTGTGPKAGASDFVLINYIGYLAADGSTFDQAMTAPLNLEGVIPGFAEGIGMMPRGSVYRLCIPAALGYGAQASGPIPANSNLVFQIELLDSKTAAEVQALQQQAQAAQAGQQAGAAAQPPAATGR